MTVIKQLEEISNAYLMVLAEGGIQLLLEGQLTLIDFFFVFFCNVLMCFFAFFWHFLRFFQVFLGVFERLSSVTFTECWEFGTMFCCYLFI